VKAEPKKVTLGGGRSIVSIGFEQAKQLADNDLDTFSEATGTHNHFGLRWLQAIEMENQLVFDSIYDRVGKNMHTSQFVIDPSWLNGRQE